MGGWRSGGTLLGNLASRGTGRDEDGEPPMQVPMRKHRFKANIRLTHESYRPKLMPDMQWSHKTSSKVPMLHTNHLLKEKAKTEKKDYPGKKNTHTHTKDLVAMVSITG